MLLSNLQALALEANERADDESGREELEHITFYEITIASVDQPKLLSRLSEALVSAQQCFSMPPMHCYPGLAQAAICNVPWPCAMRNLASLWPWLLPFLLGSIQRTTFCL